jgi:hypothetical protein
MSEKSLNKVSQIQLFTRKETLMLKKIAMGTLALILILGGISLSKNIKAATLKDKNSHFSDSNGNDDPTVLHKGGRKGGKKGGK